LFGIVKAWMNSRYAVRLLLITGAITVVLAATPYHSFDLDRFFAPKELALHAFTLALALLCLPRAAALELTVTDLLLAFYLLLSAVSALFAGDHWLAMRALAVTLSGAGVFWVSRSAAEGGARRAIVAAAAAAAGLRWRRPTAIPAPSSALTAFPAARWATAISWRTSPLSACRRWCWPLLRRAAPGARWPQPPARPL
jgi:hypothetical protein